MKGLIISIVTILVAFFGLDFLFLPAWNVSSVGFWLILAVSLLMGIVVGLIGISAKEPVRNKGKKKSKSETGDKLVIALRVELIGLAAVILVMVIGGLASTKLFHVQTYRSILSVETVEFSDVIKEEKDISDIAIMDTETAQIIGQRTMGYLTDLVSQYEISEDYSTISYRNVPVKVAPLEYGSALKYFMNKDTGIPGYVLVDPVNNTASYVQLENPMRYSPSAVFGEDLLRHIRGTYKTEIFEGMYFEIDEEGNPWWICPVERQTAGLFGATVIDSVVMVNACDGSMEKMTVDAVPQWIDRIYDGDLLCGYYNSYGTLQSGFWNSVFGNKGCTVTTEDYGYKVIDDDVWIYTGVTSVASDESNIGFVLMNQRTMQTFYFGCAGAEEFSAMSAAEGMVQDLGYTAAFPSLINVSGIPSYLMCLKDGSGLVKMYALVNVEQYNMVGTGSTQAEALKAYKTVLGQNKVEMTDSSTEDAKSAVITISDIRFIQSGGETVCYLFSENGDCFKMNFSDCEELILLKTDDMIEITYRETEGSPIYQLLSVTIR